ncbi:MAG: cytochrome P450, partial [Acidimicrobiales bacterium]
MSRVGKASPAVCVTGERQENSIDLSNPETFAAGLPHEAFAALRSTDGLYWNPMGDDDGFWAVTRHADIVEVSRDTSTYSSALGHIQLYTIDDDALEARASMIDMDPPMHTRLRRLVSSAFTPRHVQSYLAMIRDRASTLLDVYAAAGGGDFVEAISKPLPVGVICDILGVPEADHDQIVEMTDHLVEGTSARPLDPGAYGNTTELRLLPFNSPAAHAVNEYARRLGDERRANPSDDLMSKLVLAEVEGEHLSNAEIARFFQLMIFAGNETTRSTISHLAVAVAEFPAEFDRLRKNPDHIDTAVEEIIRWTSAILYFRR